MIINLDKGYIVEYSNLYKLSGEKKNNFVTLFSAVVRVLLKKGFLTDYNAKAFLSQINNCEYYFNDKDGSNLTVIFKLIKESKDILPLKLVNEDLPISVEYYSTEKFVYYLDIEERNSKAGDLIGGINIWADELNSYKWLTEAYIIDYSGVVVNSWPDPEQILYGSENIK